jgi:magnesium transporter
VIAVCAYTEDGAKEGIDPAEISDTVGRRGTLVWVDLVDATDDDMRCVQEEFSLHPLAMEDATKHGQRPKLERYPTHAFVVAYSATLLEVDLFVGPGWLVSVRAVDDEGNPWPIDGARRRFERSRPQEATSGFLLYTILDELVDGYFPATEVLEDRLEELEDRIFSEGLADEREMQQELYTLRSDLIEFRRRTQPLRDALSALLRGEVAWVDEVAITHLQDVYDHVLRATEHLDSHRELLNNAVEAHLAMISNRLNQVMKQMTAWGAILLGSALVAGIYGMNFEHMPELGWRLGYPFALGLMAVLTLTLYRLFRRRDWL